MVFSSNHACREFNHTSAPHFSNHPTSLRALDITLILHILVPSTIYQQYYSVSSQLPENICDKSYHSTVASANRKEFFDPASTLGNIHGYKNWLSCFRPHLVITPWQSMQDTVRNHSCNLFQR